MDWARDHLGNDLPAWRGGISGFGLVCPSCGEPVRRRAGGERRPHFAHFSHRAKPDCENYFPPLGAIVGSTLRTATGSPPGRLKKESLSCGLFLVHQLERDALTLWLRIPSVQLEPNANGSLEIQSGLGHRTYCVTDLHTARLVPLAPQFPLAASTGSGDLQALAAHVAGQVGGFAADVNLFYADEKGGRFIFSDEPLEWGTKYRLLATSMISPPLEVGSALDWKPGQKFGGWSSYEMALPSSFAASKAQLPEQISAFLGRRIRNGRPRLFVVQPSPHHISVDGTYVYPEPPDVILLRRSASGKVTVETSAGSVSADVSELADEWVKLEGLPAGGHDCTVSINGNEQVVLRVETCELFRPAGVVARASEFLWDICADAPVGPGELIHTEVSVDCGSPRIAAHISRLNEAWRLDGSILSALGGVAKTLYAGSFGELRGAVVVQPEMEQPSVQRSTAKPRPSAARLWVEGLVVTTFGQDGLDRVRRYLSDPSGVNLYRLGHIMTSPLMPYIRAAREQEQGSRA